MPQRTYIRDMAPNQLISGVFTLQNCQMGLTRNGKTYLKCLLADRTGRSPGRMWNASEDLFEALPTDGFVFIEGQTQPYQGEMQIIIQRIRPVEPRPEDLADLLPSTERDVDDMLEQVRRTMDSLSSPSMRSLARAYLDDADFVKQFKQAPAAMQLHHAYLGGLLEHTLCLLRLAEAVLPLYPKLNRDIVLMGLFLHDLGKCAELTWEAGFNYSDDGQLVGHVARGVVWLHEKVRQCNDAGNAIPADAVRVLEHIILSHHGVPEFGALKIPSTPEAIAIHMLDNVDAKLHMAFAAVGDGGGPDPGVNLGGNFTEKIWALGTRMYRVDPLADETPTPESTPASVAPQTRVDPKSSAPDKPKVAPQRPLRGGLD